MSDEKLPLAISAESSLGNARRPVGRVVEEMANEVIALSGSTSHLVPRFAIGSHVFCEPDYQQILLWSKTLNIEPLAVIERLLTGLDGDSEGAVADSKTIFSNGRIISLFWALDLLPIETFIWVNGLLIERLHFHKCSEKKLLRDRDQLRHQPMRKLALSLPKLSYLSCQGMSLSSLDLSDAPLLTRLDCSYNRLTSLDLSSVHHLSSLRVVYNQLSELNLSHTPQLTELDFSYNNLRGVDLSFTPLLTSLSFNGYSSPEVDITYIPLLKQLDCSHCTRLAPLQLSATPLLTDLTCILSGIKELDLSKNFLLESLCCPFNQITELDLTNCPRLTVLHCEHNELASLDLSNTLLLHALNCQANPLKELDIRFLKKVKKIKYSSETTRLLKRPDQVF